jgi:hypothetical protein
MTERIESIVPEVLEKYQIKPLETVYNGIRYRSRLEARWAIFFDSLRLQHEYEKEGFDLGDGVWYLPDFWLPQLKVWVEIKGADPDEDACDKASKLAVGSGHRVFVFFGGHTLPDSEFGAPRAYAFFSDGSGDQGYQWCECSECGQLGVEFDGRSDRLPCKEPFACWRAGEFAHFDSSDVHRSECDCDHGCKRTGGNGDKGYNANSPRLMKAYSAARAMRFGR